MAHHDTGFGRVQAECRLNCRLVSMMRLPVFRAAFLAAMLAAAVPPDFKVELLAYNSPRGYNPVGASLAIAIQGYLKKIGVEAEVRQIEFGAYLSTVRSGNFQ